MTRIDESANTRIASISKSEGEGVLSAADPGECLVSHAPHCLVMAEVAPTRSRRRRACPGRRRGGYAKLRAHVGRRLLSCGDRLAAYLVGPPSGGSGGPFQIGPHSCRFRNCPVEPLIDIVQYSKALTSRHPDPPCSAFANG